MRLFTLVFVAHSLIAQAPAPDQRMARLVADGSFAEAVELGRSLTRAGNASVSIWFHYGTALHATGDHASAIDAFRNVGRDGKPAPIAWFQIARSYARMGEQAKAIEALQSAIEAGYRDIDRIDRDADLAPLHANPRYSQLMQTLAERVKPCEVFPEYRQLDFWIGDWEQRNKAGAVVGTTRITRAKLGCALVEETVNPPLYVANVLHAYDRAGNRWTQFYVDSGAKVIRYSGELRGKEFHYRGETVIDGMTTILRNIMEPLDADHIRWLYDESQDGGQTWTTKFDGFYVRAKG